MDEVIMYPFVGQENEDPEGLRLVQARSGQIETQSQVSESDSCTLILCVSLLQQGGSSLTLVHFLPLLKSTGSQVWSPCQQQPYHLWTC